MTEDDEKKIDVIKWSCGNGYAEGFEYRELSDKYVMLSFPLYEHWHEIEWWLNDRLFLSVGWPLFLQKTIEGITQSNNDWFMKQDCEGIQVYPHIKKIGYLKQKMVHFSLYDSIDAARLAAITWVMENSR